MIFVNNTNTNKDKKENFKAMDLRETENLLVQQ